MKAIAPKSLYYIGLLVSLVGPITYMLIFKPIFESGASKGSLLALSIFGGLCVLWLFIYTTRAIFMFVDSEGAIVYGTIFFQKKVERRDIEGPARLFFYRNMFFVKILGRRYFFISLDSETNTMDL